MGLQTFFVVNKAGGLNYSKQLSLTETTLNSNDYLHLASTFHGMQLLVASLSPTGGGGGIRQLQTGTYVLHAFRADTGVQFFVTADLDTEGLTEFLREVYAIYSDYVLKNPFYELDMPIKVDLWEYHLRQLVAKYSNAARA